MTTINEENKMMQCRDTVQCKDIYLALKDTSVLPECPFYT